MHCSGGAQHSGVLHIVSGWYVTNVSGQHVSSVYKGPGVHDIGLMPCPKMS